MTSKSRKPKKVIKHRFTEEEFQMHLDLARKYGIGAGREQASAGSAQAREDQPHWKSHEKICMVQAAKDVAAANAKLTYSIYKILETMK